MAGSYFGHVSAAVDFLVNLRVLIIEVRLEGEFAAADDTSKAAAVKEREVLKRPNFVGRVDGLATPEAAVLVK